MADAAGLGPQSRRGADSLSRDVIDLTGVTDILGETQWGKGYGAPTAGEQSMSLRNRRDVTLLVEIVDYESRKVVWRGSARTTFDTMENPNERSVEILAALFEEMPPAGSTR